MPDLPISQLPTSGTLTGSEIYVFVQGGVTVRGTLNDIATFIGLASAFIPLSGTSSGSPLTNLIEYLNAYGTAVSSSQGFYVGTGGNDLDIQNANYYNAILFETPVAGQSNQIYLNNQQGTWTTRKGSANVIITTFADSAGSYFRVRAYDGTNLGEITLTPSALTANTVFTPTQNEDFIQKGYADSAYVKTKVSGSAVVAGGQITLPNNPSFIYSIHAFSLPLFLTEDYTRSSAVLSFTNPAVSDGDTIHYTYEY